MKYASIDEIEMLNEYFYDAGVEYSEDDNILVFDNGYDVCKYVYGDDLSNVLADMDARKSADDDELTSVEILVNDLANVYQSIEGKYYVI